ncbi:MAG: hypothetical protein U9P63_03060, partial [Patescibacteria group bacterium]|nr:hypothetical protein [Patescibacteria group bacterium]
MKLDELKKKIYKPEAEFEERLKFPETFQPERKREAVQPKEWEKIEKKRLSDKQKKYLRVGGISAIVIFLIIAGLFVWRGFFSFDKDKVDLMIRGPENIISGDEARYIVKYKNNTNLTIKDIQLKFYYPENSIPLDSGEMIKIVNLPGLLPGEESQTELAAKIVGLKREAKIARAELSYQPARISSRFDSQAEFSTTIISVPLIVNFDLPESLVDGQPFNFSLMYFNQAEVAFDNLQIQLEYPSGFSFQSAEPSPMEDNPKIWDAGKLIAKEQGKIFIRGNIQGKQNESKLFRARLGFFENGQFISYAEAVGAIHIISSPLSVSQTINGFSEYTGRAGQKLNYQITYQNTADIGIRDVVITSKLEGKALDFAELNLESSGGSFNGENQTITWNAGNLPALEYLGPRQKGQIDFSITIKDPLPVSNYSGKNFVAVNKVLINSLSVPLSLKDVEITGQNELTAKIDSQLSVQSRGYYADDLIPNSGPIPPRVGQTTTYTIKWNLTNAGNDLSDVRVEAHLPPHVKWLNNFNPSGADLKHNPQTGKIIWEVGSLSASAGILSPVAQTAFQVSITPGLAHLGSVVELVGQSRVTARDSFTGTELTAADNIIETRLPDDPTVGYFDGTVIE